jgi:hypothetical protein
MKLDPESIGFLREQHSLKAQIGTFMTSHEGWPINDGEVFGEAFAYVMDLRAHEVEKVKDTMRGGELGICFY